MNVCRYIDATALYVFVLYISFKIKFILSGLPIRLLFGRICSLSSLSVGAHKLITGIRIVLSLTPVHLYK